MRQGAVTIVTPIRHLDGLEQKLQTWSGSLVAPGTLHFMSAFIAPAVGPSHGVDPLPACLILEASFDGPAKAFVRELVELNRTALREIYDACAVDGDDAGSLARALLRHDVGADVLYLGTPGRSVDQIGDEQQLHDSLKSALPGLLGAPRVEAPGSSIPVAMREQLQQVARLAHDESWLLEPPRRPFWVRHTLRYLPRARLAGPIGASLLAMIALGPTLGLALLVALAALLVVGLPVLFYMGLIAAPWADLVPWLLGPAALVGAWTWYRKRRILDTFRRSFGVIGGLIPLLAIVFGTASAIGISGAKAGALLASASLLGMGVVCAVVLVILGKLLRAESDETSWPTTRQTRVEPANPQEDRQVQNHFASVTLIKPGRFRLRVLRAVLRTVQILSRVLFTVGDLGGIRSIHSGRFVILPDRKRLLFSGHYDGSWNSYLGDFAVAHGTTAIWGNTCLRDESGALQGFPRPLLLLFRGARDEQRFKSYALASWTKTLVWYGAYPNLSVQEIDRNTEIREGLFADIDGDAEALGAWLAKL